MNLGFEIGYRVRLKNRMTVMVKVRFGLEFSSFLVLLTEHCGSKGGRQKEVWDGGKTSGGLGAGVPRWGPGAEAR